MLLHAVACLRHAFPKAAPASLRASDDAALRGNRRTQCRFFVGPAPPNLATKAANGSVNLHDVAGAHTGRFYRSHEPAFGAGRQNARAGFDEQDFDDEETEMRRTLVALSTAVPLIAGSLVFGSNRAEALVGAPQWGQAAQSINPIEKTACWRLGWHGWALSPCGYYYGGYPYYGYYGYSYPYSGYGWRPYGGWGGWAYRR
jgi:hypothetical protein